MTPELVSIDHQLDYNRKILLGLSERRKELESDRCAVLVLIGELEERRRKIKRRELDAAIGKAKP